MLKDVLPDLYKSLISSSVLNIKIEETKATCGDCLRARDKRFPYLYKPNLKCCTFVPFIPNFAVGGILTLNLEGADAILKVISQRQYALPLGIFPDLSYQYKFQNKGKKDFGQDEDLLCTYYNKEKNQCSIWQYRGVVCTTYYCRSSYGQTGIVFWNELKEYLSYVEMALAEDCLVMKDFSPRDISDQLVFLNKQDFTDREKNKNSLTALEMKSYWNGYSDVVQFYKDCFRLTCQHDKKYFKEIMGQQGLKLEKRVAEAAKCLTR